jgi:benzoylsuccinyl-CoA thiolase BbsB subunit
MRDTTVIGTGMIRFGRHQDRTYADLARPAVLAALEDAGVEPDDIDATYCGHAFGGMLVGQRILRDLGMTGPPVVNVENACSSGSTALRQAHLAVSSGVHDVALVIGVDKLTQFNGGPLPLEKEDWEARQGIVMPAVYAMRARRYMHEFGATKEDLAAVSVKARAHGARNPDAQLQSEVTVDDVLAARPVAEPFTLFQCCPTGDGAAAVVVCAADHAPTGRGAPVRILASSLESGRYTTGFRDMTVPAITVRGAHEAYAQAGITSDDVDVAEVHDAFSIAELLYYEALGFCERGEAPALLRSGETSVGGGRPVNPSGGLLAKGHPVGATGVAQVVEVVRQLQGRCDGRQVEGARIGLAHATGGGLTGLDHGACAIHIFAR